MFHILFGFFMNFEYIKSLGIRLIIHFAPGKARSGALVAFAFNIACFSAKANFFAVTSLNINTPCTFFVVWPNIQPIACTASRVREFSKTDIIQPVSLVEKYVTGIVLLACFLTPIVVINSGIASGVLKRNKASGLGFPQFNSRSGNDSWNKREGQDGSFHRVMNLNSCEFL